ncbi:hypothetical protein B5P43_35605 [Bacillus sp. SRB_336]|nr:hypothetical protein B5P43_35605 [Bacillus sp. SRB_336]
MTISPIPAEAITALLEEDGLPESVRWVLAQSTTYKVRDRLSPAFEEAFNTNHGALLLGAKTTAANYLLGRGLKPPV